MMLASPSGRLIVGRARYLLAYRRDFEHFDLAWPSEHLGYPRWSPASNSERCCRCPYRRSPRPRLSASGRHPEAVWSALPARERDRSATRAGRALTRRHRSSTRSRQAQHAVFSSTCTTKCDEYNQGLDTARVLQELDCRTVIELHVARRGRRTASSSMSITGSTVTDEKHPFPGHRESIQPRATAAGATSSSTSGRLSAPSGIMHLQRVASGGQ